MNTSAKTILRAGAPVLALVVLALGMRLLPSAMGNTDAGAPDAPPPIRVKPDTTGKRRILAPHDALKPTLVDQKTQQALQKAVTGQLTAFGRDDFAAALNFSVPEFRQSWSPESFREMIRSGFAPMMIYKRATFAPARVAGDSAMLPVTITTKEGGNVAYIYTFRRSQEDSTSQASGSSTETGKKATASELRWYIDGVSPLGPTEDSDDSGTMIPVPPDHSAELQEA